MSESRDLEQSQTKDNRPLSIKLVTGYAFVFATLFLLYGGVKVVLSFLDHNYQDFAQPIVILVMGLILLAPAFAFRDSKPWGYWGLVVINGLVVILSVIGFRQYENLVLLVFSGLALYTLLSKKYLYLHR